MLSTHAERTRGTWHLPLMLSRTQTLDYQWDTHYIAFININPTCRGVVRRFISHLCACCDSQGMKTQLSVLRHLLDDNNASFGILK